MHFPFFPLLFLLSYAPHLFSFSAGTAATSIAAHNRRSLHQPFFPQGSLPPSKPPVPSPPAATVPIPHPPGPFFPTIPSHTPPPPSPSSLSSFPANISSLTLPQNPKSKSRSVSSKLIAAAIAIVLAAVSVVGVIIFLHIRKRRLPGFSQEKNYISDNSNSNGNFNAGNNPNGHVPKLRRPSQTSSEFLYLGTLVSSHGGIDSHASSNARAAAGNGGENDPHLRKMDSPELHPLPPLRQQSFGRSCENVDVGSSIEDETEEFYSPRGSLGGRESSIGTGSASRRVMAAVEVENLVGNTSGSTSSSFSSSSSGLGSPARSVSLSISPPVSLSPRSSRPKSPELVPFQTAPPPPPPALPVFIAQLVTSSGSSSPSPSPPTSSSPERELRSSIASSPRISNASTESLDSTARLSSPLQQILDPSPRIISPVRQILNSPAISSPAQQILDSLARISSPAQQILDSPARISSQAQQIVYCPARISSPEQQISDSPARSSSPALQILDSPPRISSAAQKILDSPVRISSPVQQHLPVNSSRPLPPPPPPPPAISIPLPPPPPPLPPARQWESPRTPTPPARQPVSKPPVLTTPLKPIAIQSPTLVSPMELPPSSDTVDKNEETPKPKLKPLHWDKVRASSDREMVWDQLKSSSFKLNEEMIETLFVVNTPNSNPKEATRRPVLPSPSQENRVLDPKKSQNIAILLRALNVTAEEVCEALLEGNADTLGTELLESLLKMAPTKEEERKLKEYKDDSPIKLGPAEKFLKAVLDIPYAFKRVDAMLYTSNFDSEIEYLKKSLETLEAACEELRNSRMFLKLLEAVLKTGNRMNVGTNRGDAHAFKLDTLLKLVDVKGADGKTTLLHFVVQEIIKSEGARPCDANQNPVSIINDDVKCRKLGLQVVSGIGSELANVKKAATMDAEVLNGDVLKLSRGIMNIAEVVQLNEAMGLGESDRRFSESMNIFMKMAGEEIIRVQAQESVALSLVKEITEYFHGNSAKEEAHPFRIFMVVRDFLAILDRVCKEVGMINERTIVSSAHKFPVPVNPMLQPTFGGFTARRQCSSSDDERSSP